MPIKARQETLEQLSNSDIKALKSVYFHRCLNEELLKQYFYAEEELRDREYTRFRIQWLIQQELLDIAEYGDDECAFFLTKRGLQTVRTLFDQPLYAIDRRTGHKRYNITASELRPPQSLLNHQMHLNALSLDIEARCGLPQGCYKDSKYAENFTYAQPDGVFELPEFDIFLEMDLAHERLSDLKAKWNHYRYYRSSKEYYLHRDKRMVVLFATENIKRGFSIRRGKVLKSLADTVFDLLGESFECYVGPAAEMADVASQIIAGTSPVFQRVGMYFQTQLGYTFSRPAAIRELCGESYLYMRQLDEHNRVRIRDGTHQSWFLEDYVARPVSVLKRAASYGHTASILAPKLGRDVPLLLVVPNERLIYQDLAAVDMMGVKNIFFTTEERLNRRLLHDAVFQFDQLGNRYHFTDFSFSVPVHEKKGG